MGIVSRYVARTWCRLFVVCQGGFLTVYLILDFMEKLGRFLKAGASFGQIGTFFLFKIPEMVGQTMPFAVLMATLLALGLLSRSSELTALRSCGRSIPQIVMPILLLGAVCSGFMLFNAEFVVPDSYRRMEYVEKVLIRKQGINTFFRLNNIWFRSEERILQASVFDPQARMLKGVTVWELSPAMEPLRRLDAEQAVPVAGGWRLERVTDRTFSSGGAVRKLAVLALPLSLKVDDLRVLDNNADNLSFRQLREYAHSLEKGGYAAGRWLTMMHAKIAVPFSGVVMVLLGIPFALRTGRSGGVAMGVGAGVAIGFAYFIINAAIQSYGRSGVLPPVVAAWGANLIFVLTGIWLSMTVRQQ
ncbi:LPS export ABC transporter permease LptG [Trichlorobacter ammonificans]|uniref:Lipopolysaccharide export system permease protein n=1 Tax=Trichlorobacter ammonificans TaxID=2916410 RepID=A0ABM9D715_9BACT|nr:LPS export ABC transporter permease LptG [Trichlorobacter ammonificans]CAH2030968.1 Lipopolysaccharide export system permease protein [Trichlorobacter ammonificans]